MASEFTPSSERLPGLDVSPTHTWIGEFAAQLMAYGCGIGVGAAVQCAVESFHVAADQAPQTAAECYALANFPADFDRAHGAGALPRSRNAALNLRFRRSGFGLT